MKKHLKLSLKYMLNYPKRTIAMILSIFLSIFFIVTMGSLSQSSRNADVLNIKKATGAQHAIFREVNQGDIHQIQSNPKVKKLANMFYYDTWMARNGLRVNLLGGEENILYMEDTKILTGRFPTKGKEIALEEWVLERLNLSKKIGQTLNIPLQQGGETQEFKLTGIIKDRADEKSTGNMEGYVAYHKENLLGREEHINSLVEFKEKTDIPREIKALGKSLNLKDEEILPNKMLLNAMGNLEGIDWELVKIAFVLMLVGGMVIYSVYNISSLKRIQQYGILRAIGSTKKQLIYMMLGEIGIIYVIGAILGVLAGSVFVHLFKGINIDLFTVEGLGGKLDIILISPRAIQLALIIGLGSVLAAGGRAIWMAGRISPIEAMKRNTQDKKIEFKDREGWIEGHLDISNRISYRNLMRNKKALLFTAITMTIGCSIYMVGSFRAEMFDRDREYYNNIYKSKAYEFTLNVNEGAPIKQVYSLDEIKELEKLPQVEDVLARGVVYSRLEFPTTALNGNFGRNYLKYMQKRDMALRVQSAAPVEGKSGFAFESEDKRKTTIRNTILGLSPEELKPLEKDLKAGHLPDLKAEELQGLVYIPKATEKGTFVSATGKEKKEPVIDLKVGDKIKVAYPKEGYEKSIENYLLIMDYEKYKEAYIDKEITITGMIEELPVQDNFHLGTSNAPYLLMTEEGFKEFTGMDGYRIISIDMKDNASRTQYQELQKKVQKLSEVIPGTNLMNQVELQKSTEESGRQYKTLRNTIAGILIFISGLSIYNNINYNLLSRLREHGILKAIGLTQRQFKKMIQFEGLAYGWISAFFACSISFLIQLGTFLYWAYISPFPLYQKQFFLQWQPYILVLVINLIIGYLATLGPIYQVNKTEITEEIRTVE